MGNTMVSRYLTDERRKWLDELASRHPERRAITLPAVWSVQQACGHVPAEAMDEIAEFVGVSPAQVQEIVTFYSMFREKPAGRCVLSVCGSLSCALCGGEGLLAYLEDKLGIKSGETTADGLFTIEKVMCQGACVWAPTMLVNDRIYVQLTRAKVDKILEQCSVSASDRV